MPGTFHMVQFRGPWLTIFTQLFYSFTFRAQNNFGTVARHNDWPKKFLLVQILFSDRSKKKVEKREIILV